MIFSIFYNVPNLNVIYNTKCYQLQFCLIGLYAFLSAHIVINYGPHWQVVFVFFRTSEFSTLTLKFLVSWTENPHLSFRGIDVSTFLRLFYDTFHRDRAVRQLLLTAFQYLRMRPASGWDKSQEGLNPAPIFLSHWKWVRYGCQSNVRWDDQILDKVNWRLCKCWGTIQKTWDRGRLDSSSLISWKNDLHLWAFAAHLPFRVLLYIRWPCCHIHSKAL